MPKLSPQDKQYFNEYLKAVETCVESIYFLLDNMGENIELDYSVNSLEVLEKLYWDKKDDFPIDITSSEHFASLIGQYFGECVVHHTDAKWIQCKSNNHLFSQPCIDGYGENKWEVFYPTATANALPGLPLTNPKSLCVKQQRVFASKLEDAIKIYKRKIKRKQRC